jgi:hypothetical protein
MKKLKFYVMAVFFAATLHSCNKDEQNGSRTQDKGIVINGVKWATSNIDKPGTFAAKPEDFGMFYQWNRKTGWSATDPMINSNGGTEWDNSKPFGTTWEKNNDPSPIGCHIPSLSEIETLFETGKVSNLSTTINGVAGIKFIDKATGNSIFLPFAGYRYHGELSGDDNYYWSSTVRYDLHFDSDDELDCGVEYNDDWYSGYGIPDNGFSVRCVVE